MNGNVLGFDTDTHTGAISGDDGNRYDFALSDWRGPRLPRRGDRVDFQAIEQRATDIALAEPVYMPPSVTAFYFSPGGRISRAQYWLRFLLPFALVSAVLDTVIDTTDEDSTANFVASILLMIFSLVALWPAVAVLVKRMHDRGKSGWLVFCVIVPALALAISTALWLGPEARKVAAGGELPADMPLGAWGAATLVSAIILLGVELWFFIEFCCLRGTAGANRFGPDPLGR
jgi:uncharacterized membrane protein YhaH (DUF805 family)